MCFDAEKRSYIPGFKQAFLGFSFYETMKCFRYLDRMHPLYELSGSLSYILCFTIYISLRENLKNTLQKLSFITTVFSPQKHIEIGIR